MISLICGIRKWKNIQKTPKLLDGFQKGYGVWMKWVKVVKRYKFPVVRQINPGHITCGVTCNTCMHCDFSKKYCTIYVNAKFCNSVWWWILTRLIVVNILLSVKYQIMLYTWSEYIIRQLYFNFLKRESSSLTRWRGVTFDDKVTWCTVWGQLKTLISFDPAILLLEKLPHRYTSVQRKMERRTEKHPLEVKKKKVETT